MSVSHASGTNDLPSRTVRILHISDIHLTNFCVSDRHEAVNAGKLRQFLQRLQDPVRERVKKSLLITSDLNVTMRLARWIVENTASFDMAVISGDLADSGSNDEMDLAREFVGKKKTTINPASPSQTIPGSGRQANPTIATLSEHDIPIVLFPGNHDHFASKFARFQNRSSKTMWYRDTARRFEVPPSGSGGRVVEYRFARDRDGNICPTKDGVSPSDSFAILTIDFAIGKSMGRWPSSPAGFVGQGRVRKADLVEVVDRTVRTQKTMPVLWATHFSPEPLQLEPHKNVRKSLRLIGSEHFELAAKELKIPLVFAGHTHQFLDLTGVAGYPNTARAASAGCLPTKYAPDSQTGIQIVTFDLSTTKLHFL